MEISIKESPKNILCFSHLPWDFVFQRPQHLLSRFAENYNTYFWEEPFFEDTEENYLSIVKKAANLTVLVPHLKVDIRAKDVNDAITILVDQFLLKCSLNEWIFWFYTPTAYSFTQKHKPMLTIYDCINDPLAFEFPPIELVEVEKKLIERIDLVFTGGHSLFNAKKSLHDNIYPFPSSIEKEHFAKGREEMGEPQDQQTIAGVKIGFFGVIDERFDIELIRNIAVERPEWQLILIGPIVKVAEEILPKNSNIHFFGQKSYAELPAYISYWDIALIPFLLNDSTSYISPTKTPAYLAAGKPVVSTPIRDVINPYGINSLVHICENYQGFINAIEEELETKDRSTWLKKVDKHLENLSWDRTVREMNDHILNTLKSKNNNLK